MIGAMTSATPPVWSLRGTAAQQAIAGSALAACDFPFDLLRPSLAAEGKASIDVSWSDLSRYTHGAAAHEHADGAHTISREVDGRARVLGLFYLPPHTAVVLDLSLASLAGRPDLAREVFLAEAAHAVDYHYMTDGQRVAVWNAMHPGTHEDLTDAAGVDVPESGDLHHGHSWFDGPGGYSSWAGEGFMAAFCRAFAPSVPVTITLEHDVRTADAVAAVRAALLPAPPVVELPPADPVFATATGATFHDAHRGISAGRRFPSRADAVAAGLRPCGTCRP